ncbi:CP2 transcription factor [Cunninghamella echinulata]|nr:CP2 transcription factor [Cunninghamella echinulata]
MQQSSALTTSLFSTPNQQEKQQNNSKLLRFHIVLQASTAISQKSEGAPITYLNRGQSYSIHLNDRFCEDNIIHSQFIIAFHDPSHQKIAVNYWRFWISQQKDSQHARAVDVDMSQSTGILNVKYPSFDRIDFYWHGRNGAKLSLKFHCLSTDFSRIKGVKGIPLRAYVSSQMTTSMDPLLMCQYSGSFIPSRKTDNSSPTYLDYNEHCYCKVKLFRDKGAERKNKDDAKQIKRQFEKMMTGKR